MHYEFVKVLDRTRLLNPVQIECHYQTPRGRPLARGIYAVLWPAESATGRYDASAHYYGPFPSWREAGDFVRSTFDLRPIRPSAASGAS